MNAKTDDVANIEQWRSYFYPNTIVLKNKLNIKDQRVLNAQEALLTANRRNELEDMPVQINDSTALFAIHKHLFQDIYEWAGEKRTINMATKHTVFASTNVLEQELAKIDKLIFEYKQIDTNNVLAISKKLAGVLDAINYCHPFREGNGRAQREFIRILALEKNLILDLNTPDDAKIYNEYMTATIHRDVDTLSLLIYEYLEPQITFGQSFV
jgi:cell filamentation protein